jgi:5-methylthioadenosine/S-adenosylhomocysteine deaminase
LAANQFAPLQTIDLEGKVIIPGLINTHGHWAMTVFRGLADDLALEAWLNSIWKVEAAVVSPEMVCAGAQLAMIEMIRSGTTCAADMYWYYPESCMAALEAGFRVVNGHSFAAIPGFERREADVKQAIDFIDRFQGNELVHACIQAQSTYTTDQQMLEDIAQ